jgi:hypothetical protein
MKTIVIGVMPQEQIWARAIAIAKGEYKPKPGEPKIWFTSMKSVAEVLSDQNRAAEGDPGDQPGFHGGAGQGHRSATGQSVAYLKDDVALRAGGTSPLVRPRDGKKWAKI